MKTILITGATDGIGLATAEKLCSLGHTVLLHGRSEEKLNAVENRLSRLEGGGRVESYLADLAHLQDVDNLADSILNKHSVIDVLINNAGVFKTSNPITEQGLDVRFVVNTLAPYKLTQRLLPVMPASGRIVNLSSAAQSPVDSNAIAGKLRLDDMAAYSQSKLAITMWSKCLAEELGASGPVVIAVNPGSLLASKMVKEGFGVPGKDISIGADILIRASLADEFADVTGQYFDNDSQQFALPHPDAQDRSKSESVLAAIKALV